MTSSLQMPTMDAAHALAERAYERARGRRAIRTSLWVLPLISVALALTERRLEVALLGTLVLLGVWLADWRGKEWGRALPAGLAGGLLNFGAAISARWVMSDCCASGAGCSDWCVPACATAGGLAGLLTVLDAGRTANPLPPHRHLRLAQRDGWRDGMCLHRLRRRRSDAGRHELDPGAQRNLLLRRPLEVQPAR